MIRYLRHPEIDKGWWDQQLLRCENRMWYAQSWVLDITSPGWDALVDETSGAIMPLTWRRRFVFKYLFQPYGTQQLGVFAPRYDEHVAILLLKDLPRHFSLCDIALNEAMQPAQMEGSRITPLTQQVLPLQLPYEQLVRSYSVGHRRNLRKAADGPPLTTSITAKEFREAFALTTAKRFNSGSRADHDMMERLIGKAIEMGQCSLYGIRHENRLCAAACFMEWQGRAIYYKTAADAMAYEIKAMFRITDHYIRRYAGRPLLLDFAGSNTPSVARFNSGFGAQGRIYLRLQRNDLPFPFKILKK